MVSGLKPALLAADFALLSAPPILRQWTGTDTRAYALVTLLLVVINVTLVLLWDGASLLHHNGHEGPKGRYPTGVTLGLLCVLCGFSALLIIQTCATWLHEILVQPHD